MSDPEAPIDLAQHDVHMDGVFFCHASAEEPFINALEPGNYSYCVMIRSGRMHLQTDFPTGLEIELEAGDAVAISGLAPHVFRSGPAASGAFVGSFQRRPFGTVAPEACVDLVLGVAPIASIALGSLMVGPIVVRAREHADLSRRLWSAVAMLEDEYADNSSIDRNLVIRRLAEIMLVNFSRCVLAHRTDPPAPASWPILRAINAFLRAPGRAWSLTDLSREAGISRTRFAEEFKLVTGHTPGHIISRMRLTAVARRMATDSLSVEAAAEEAGYSSSAAFVRAFQREFGETPARWRRQRRGAQRASVAVVRPRQKTRLTR